MPTVHSISFDVRFDLTSAPTLILTDTTTSYPVGAIGIFSITMPDGYTRTGNFLIPDVTSSGGTFSDLLRFDSDGNVQCGTYKIDYQIKTTDTVVTNFSREFVYQYKPVEHKFETNIDVFAPEFYSKDITDYAVAGYNNTAPVRSWLANSIPTGNITDTAQKFYIDYLGDYYDAQYTVTLESTILYTHQTYTWQSVNEKITSSFTFDACTPLPIEDLIDEIEQLRLNSIECNGDLPKFEKAQSLFTHLMDMVRVSVVGNVLSEQNIYDVYQDLLFELDRVQVCSHTYVPINEYDISKYVVDRYDTLGSYCTVIGDGNNAQFTVEHNLSDDCVIVQVYNYLTKELILCDIKILDKENVMITFNSAPDVNQYLVVVHAGTSHLKGREVQIQATATHIQWRYEDEATWTNLVALSTLIGPQGPAGATGATGATGAPGAGIATGGTTGQFLRKNSATNYDTNWDTLDAADIPDLSATYLTKAAYDTDNDGQVDDAEKMTVIARNSTGSTIYKGTIVYLSGSTGNRPNMYKAQANTEATSSKTFGVVIEDVPNNADGRVAEAGTLHDLDTRNNAPNPFTSDVLLDGDLLWLSPTTPGYVTRVKPSAPNHLVFIGHVARTSPTNGRIIYRIINGFELDEIHDIAFVNKADKDVLAYNSATSLWGNISKAAWLGGLSTQFVKGDGSLQTATFLTTESDPVFAASPAGAITGTDVSNWNDAYGWGDHALAGYLTQVQAASQYITTAGSYSNPSWLTSLAWSKITGKPTTIAGYGINDSLVYETGSYTNPSWITSLAWSKITGTPTTLFDYGITDALSSSASYTNPSFIVSLDWSKITGTPSTLSGYGITNAYTKTEIDNTIANYIPLSEKGAANGVATLDAAGLVPASQLPSYVDDVREYSSLGAFPGTGSTGIIYVALDTNETYRWSGSTYIKISNGAVQSVNTLTGNVVLTTSEIAEGTNLYYTDSRSRGAISLTTTGSSGASTYNNSTGVFNIPTYTLSGLGGVPTSRSLTINGTTYDLSSDRSWTINAVTALSSLTDVAITSPSNAQLLRYNSTSTKWENWTPNYLTSYTETDPIFVASAAYGITSTNISNWDTAYGWGNHATAGYVTGNIYTASGTLSSNRAVTLSTYDLDIIGSATTRFRSDGKITFGHTNSPVALFDFRGATDTTVYIDNTYGTGTRYALIVQAQGSSGVGTNVGGYFNAQYGAENVSLKTDYGHVYLNSLGGSTLIGSPVDEGYKFDVYGTARIGSNASAVQLTVRGSLETNGIFTTEALSFTGTNKIIYANGLIFNTNNNLGNSTKTIYEFTTQVPSANSGAGGLNDLVKLTPVVNDGDQANDHRALVIDFAITSSLGTLTAIDAVSGKIRFRDLTGTGTRMVVADSSGVLSTQSISSGGSGTVTSVALDTGTTGTDVNVSGSPITGSGTITLNIPSASATARGLVTTGSQTFSGTKSGTFTGEIINANISTGNFSSQTNFHTSAGTSASGTSSSGRLFGGNTTVWYHVTSGDVNTTVSFANTGLSFWNIGKVTATTASTGTHPSYGVFVIAPMTINDGGASVTNYATLYIGGAASGTATITNNYAVWVDNGNVRIDTLGGTGTRMVVADSNGVLSTQAIPTGGSGTVTSVSVVSANGFAGTVATDTTTPAITISTTVTGIIKGNGTAISAAVAGTDYQEPITLTTTGSSGASTFSSNTLNIPTYTLSGLGGVPTSRTITINGTALDLSADRSFSVGTVTSVSFTTGTSGTDVNVSGSPITESGTITLNIPNASASARGLVSVGSQTFNGTKSFDSPIRVNSPNTLDPTGSTQVGRWQSSSGNFNVLSSTGNQGSLAAAPNYTETINTDYSYSNLILSTRTLNKAATGTHNLWSQIAIKPFVVGSGSATITNTALLYIENAATGGTNNYAVWVDDGNVRIDTLGGTGTRMVVADANGVMSTQAIPTGSGSAYNVTSQTSNYTVTETSGTAIVKCDTTSGGFTVTLPTAVGNTATIIIKKTAGSGALVVDGNGSETIDGGLTATINKVYESITLISDNSNWQII